jgi:hypothetical protein
MKTLGRRSLAAFLQVALRVVQILLLVFIPFVAFGCVVMLLKTYGVALEFTDMRPARAPLFAWIFTVRMTAIVTVAIIIVSRLRSIFATLAAGDPFVPENAAHLRVIWVTLAIGELVRYALDGIRTVALNLRGESAPAWMDQGLLNISIGMWFAVLTVIVLAEVFREGSRLRQEQQYTV